MPYASGLASSSAPGRESLAIEITFPLADVPLAPSRPLTFWYERSARALVLVPSPRPLPPPFPLELPLDPPPLGGDAFMLRS